ncbi:MAG TPA: hypothetical protein EYQ54_19010 [Myxococcales bacterium]|nr:hypothetical protein [Myxococcales bacterium]HIL80962.1 hypothetical protein [Myxococcales bacterium]
MAKKVMLAAIALTLALWVANAGTALAGNENTNARGDLNALDANQGTGVQVNADHWENMDNVLAGDGTQTQDTVNNANTGEGLQDNSTSSADGWDDLENANNGSATQTVDSSNSNGGDRISNDIVLSLGDDGSSVSSAALEATVSGNSVLVNADFARADSEMSLGAGSGFRDLAGVSAVAMAAGANASQNVSVNVTAAVSN